MARKLWINLTDSFAQHKTMEEPPRHFMVSLGFGHVLPMDDLFIHREGGLPLDSFSLNAPNGGVSQLRLPSPEAYSLQSADCGIDIETGDLAAHKLSIGKDAIPGTYQVAAESSEFFVSQYVDEKGMMVWDPKPMNEFPKEQEILASFRTKIYAKAFPCVGEWTQPKALGHELEILPVTDLSNVHPGDAVSFDVSYMGKPFTCTQDSMEYIVAASNTYGGEAGGSTEGFFLSAYAINGKARFVFPTAGQWIITAFSNQWIREQGEWSDYAQKCQRVFHSASVTLNVKAL